MTNITLLKKNQARRSCLFFLANKWPKGGGEKKKKTQEKKKANCMKELENKEPD